jgi:hypothetical protein
VLYLKSMKRDPEFEMEILGRCNSDFAKDPGTRKRVSGDITFLCEAFVIQRSSTRTVPLMATADDCFGLAATDGGRILS